MIEEALHGVAVYNPDLLSRDELKRYFVGRLPLLERILADLRREPPGRIPQHRLFLGQRGMGKTSLLRRLAVAIDEDPELAAIWLPLTFPEEQYNIARPADLWLNCLDALGDALDRAGRRAEAQALDERIEGLAGAAPETVLAALLDEAARLGRRLLLLLDNADLILDRLRDSHWALRETLQSRTELLVFGASARAIEASYKYDAAFYDFFRIDELKGLTEEELRATLIRLAEVGNTPAVAELVRSDPARIRTLHVLTGGNPRTTVLLYGVLAQGGGGDVRSDLEGLLDRVTPLYKARFEELPELSQKLVDALALHWDPATARQIADRLGWEINLVSAQLARLQTQGLVEKTEPYRGKRALFQIGERFFNIWYLMRASRRVRRRLTWLVRFLRMWFNAEELQGHARGQLARRRSNARDAEYSLALAQCIDSPPLRSALETHGLRALIADSETRTRIGEMFDLSGEDAFLRTKVERMQALAETRERASVALEAVGAEINQDAFLVRLLGNPELPLALKLGFADVAKDLSHEQWREINAAVDAGYTSYSRAFGQEPDSLYRALAEGDMDARDDVDGAQAAAERLSAPELVPISWSFREVKDVTQAKIVLAALQVSSLRSPWILSKIGDLLQDYTDYYEEAEQAYRHAIEFDSAVVYPWNGLGNLLQFHLARYDDAEQAYRRAIHCEPKLVAPWCNLGTLLSARFARYEDAEQAYRQAIAINPNDADPWYKLGNLLNHELGRYEDAEQAYRRAIDINPDYSRAWSLLGTLLLYFLRRREEGEQALRHAIELDSNDAYPWWHLGNLLKIYAARYDEAEQAFRHAIELDPNDPENWLALGHLLEDNLARYGEAEQAFRRAVAMAPEDARFSSTLACFLYHRGTDASEAKSAAKRAAELAPSSLFPNPTLATILIKLDDWTTAAPLIRRLIEVGVDSYVEMSWEEIILLFRAAVTASRASEALDLLDRGEAGERWRPLREAIAAALEGTPDYLREVAPEVRRPAEQIYARLTAPVPPADSRA
ncbi:tetratricopeptide repeat protein [uncultured Thiodictyon sp.]|jgi:tetratricopeptide (TPR) repeat protein|uniref:tetratricopeptide repeat protein n=1 Tax=uncultured Thiodictyon sp. TaxID=1846217 RepID=UPI0025FC7C6E|nr:tetratricopeptide repeat protein [uncultured Thiodictyon sp.]